MIEFNESNTIEAAIVDRLTRGVSSPQLDGVAEPQVPYHKAWEFIHGSDLPREPQDVFVESWLKEALCRLNPEIAKDPDKADEVIHTLRAVLYEANNDNLVSANMLFTEWLRGEKSMPLGKNNEHITINFMDYNDLSNNYFVISQQVSFHGAKNAFFDLVLYVNGIPLVVGEVKTPVRMAVTWQDGAGDFMGGTKHYWKHQERFFVPNLLCFATEGKTFAYGAINAEFRNWMPWHKTTDPDDIPQNMSTVIKSTDDLLTPRTLLELLESFALFSTTKVDNSGSPKRTKLLPRYPQYEAARQIVERVKSNQPRKGLIWHFQGSGKSLLMLYAAKMLKADPALRNPTVVVVVDRVDLDSQINTTFENADVKNVTTVGSCTQLEQELKNDSRNILITTIFKFEEVKINTNNNEGLNARDNIIVLVDEAHRTQEGSLGEKMRWALPNAFFFGLTGTPISSTALNTFRLFGADEDLGRYMNRYSYRQSIRDKSTLPVRFEPRLVELRVDEEAINSEFEALIERNHLSEVDKALLSEKAGKLANLLKSPNRMEAIADDIHEHFTSHVQPKGLKAMVVVYDKQTCALMYNLLTADARFGEGTCEVIMNTSSGSVEDEKDEHGNLKAKAADWEKWQDLGTPLDKEAFKRWQAIDASPAEQERVLDQYRDASDPLQILIVTRKLLTGFDAPICYCMYLDRLLRDHGLLQAMCRTNRLYDNSKQHGLIIDYLGVFENLGRALAYDPKEIEGVVERLSAYKEQVPIALEKCLAFFPGVDRNIGGFEGLMAAQECLKSNDMRDKFAAKFNVLRRLWEALTPDTFLNPYRVDYRWLAMVYDSVRPVSGLGSLIWQALGPETIRLIHENTDVIDIPDDFDPLVIDENAIFTLTEAEQKKQAKILEINLRARIRKQGGDPRYIELGQRLEELREQYETDVISSIKWLEDLLVVARQTVELDNQAESSKKIVPDNKTALTELFEEVKNDKTPEIIANIVDDIDAIVEKTRFDGWQDTRSGNRDIQKALRETLHKYQLHKNESLFDKTYAYIKEHY